MRAFHLLITLLFAFMQPMTGAEDRDKPAAPDRPGTLILSGGASTATESIRQRFVDLAGGPDANFVIIHSNQDKLPVDMMIVPDFGAARAFGVKKMTGLCTLKREFANSDTFVAPIRKANAVWITGGKPDNLASVYCDTLVQRELKALLDRGGVIGGESAGAMIQASHLTDSIKVPPGQPADTGCYSGFGFVSNVVIAPHVIKMGWLESLVPIVAANPKLLGLGIDENAAIVVQGDRFEVIGQSKVAVYDNRDHQGRRYYFLSPGDRFDLTQRRATPKATTRPTSQP